jgi:hypothetical protein
VKTLRATLELYRAALQDGAKAYGRGIIGAFGLLLGSAFLLLVSTVLGPLIAPFGGAGSFLFGLFFSALMAYVVGAYLACVEAALDARMMVPPSTLTASIGHYFSESIGVMFWLWIAGARPLVRHRGQRRDRGLFVAAVLFNPIPELIYNKRVQAPRIFEESARWVWSNWPEWFVPQVAIGLVAGSARARGLEHRGASADGWASTSSARSRQPHGRPPSSPRSGAPRSGARSSRHSSFPSSSMPRWSSAARSFAASIAAIGAAAPGRHASTTRDRAARARISSPGKAGTVFALSQYRAEQVVRGVARVQRPDVV